MVAATKPPRRPLAEVAEEAGFTPVSQEEPETQQEEEYTPGTDEVRVSGVFDGFDVLYIARVPMDNVAVALGQLTNDLRACGFEPRPVKAPSGPPPAAQNSAPGGRPPANRGGGAPQGGGYRGGQQRGGGGFNRGGGGSRGGGYQQREDFSNEDLSWQYCGHGPNHVKRGKFGLECSFYSNDPNEVDEGAREWWDSKAGMARYYCPVKDGN